MYGVSSFMDIFLFQIIIQRVIEDGGAFSLQSRRSHGKKT